MISEYEISASKDDFASELDWTIRGKAEWKPLVKPHSYAPVIVDKRIELMRFSIQASWSRGKMSYPTHAPTPEQLRKSPWRWSFTDRHCLVPMQRFFEVVQSGPYSGKKISFGAPKIGLLFVAGIYDKWKEYQGTEVVESFAIVTQPAPRELQSIGLNFQPLVLEKSAAVEWLNNEREDFDKLYQFVSEGGLNARFEPKIE